MSKPTVFIDGEAGTTGLQIRERLEGRSDLELIFIDADKRKDVDKRSEIMNSVDVVILCLPDQAAREAVELIAHPMWSSSMRPQHTASAMAGHMVFRKWILRSAIIFALQSALPIQDAIPRALSPSCAHW